MEIKEITFGSDTRFRKQYFVPEHFSHPAKMNAYLLIYLVERYSKPGDVILDVMAGAGTLLLATTLGRHCVLVELEDKFVKMQQDNWDKIKSLGPMLGFAMGKAVILQGDARNLEGLLADNILFSPPYAEAQIGDNRKTFNPTIQGIKDGKRRASSLVSKFESQSENPNNIQNLPYGEVSAVISSPPFSEQMQDVKWMQKNQPRKHRATHDPKKQNPSNIGNLKYGNADAVITSPPYRGAHQGISDENSLRPPHDTTKLTCKGYGKADAILTSPPYEGSLSGESKSEEKLKELYNKKNVRQSHLTPGRLKHESILSGGYSGSDDNIGNLKSENYLEAMIQVYRQCHKVLKDKGIMVLVTKNFIRDKKVIRLDLDTIKLCEKAGFKLKDILKRKLTSQSFWRIIYHNKFPDVEKIEFEEILVFEKETKCQQQ